MWVVCDKLIRKFEFCMDKNIFSVESSKVVLYQMTEVFQIKLDVCMSQFLASNKIDLIFKNILGFRMNFYTFY